MRPGTGVEPSPWAPLRQRVFAGLWVGVLISGMGTWMQTLGAQWLLVDVPNATTLVALVQAANTLPVMLLAMPSGVLADSFDRRWLLFCVQVYFLLVGVLFLVLTLTGLMPPSLLLVFTFLLGVGAPVQLPAWQASTGCRRDRRSARAGPHESHLVDQRHPHRGRVADGGLARRARAGCGLRGRAAGAGARRRVVDHHHLDPGGGAAAVPAQVGDGPRHGDLDDGLHRLPGGRNGAMGTGGRSVGITDAFLLGAGLSAVAVSPAWCGASPTPAS